MDARVPLGMWDFCNALNALFMDVWICHDYLYATGILSREDADKLMMDLLIERGMTKAKAYMIYSAVRIFGRAGIFSENKFNFDK